MKITVQQALQAQNQLSQSQIARCTGDAAISIYFLRNDIKQAFEKHFKDFDEAKGGTNELTDKQKDILEKDEKVTLTRGKLKLNDIKDHATAVDLQLLEPFINFEPENENMKAVKKD